MKTHLYAATSLVTFLAIGFAYSTLYGVKGMNYLTITLIFLALGLVGAAVIYWWHSRKARKEGQSATSGAEEAGEVGAIIREAEARLAASQQARGAKLGTLPLVFVIGEPGATKTSVILNSGIDPELLSGHVYQNNQVAPTQLANIWYAQQTIFAEAGARIFGDNAQWQRFVRKLAPGRLRSAVRGGEEAPRAALVCVDTEAFLQSGAANAITAAARKLHDRLGEISQVLGIRLPVYVLFTRIDRVAYLADFVHTMNNEEVGQVLGATLPLRLEGDSGVYAQEESGRLTKAFNDIFHSLCDHRLVLLPRENDSQKLPGSYEFPRELTKLRSLLVQFLIDLCRPSQLRSNPFLRGFYFSGVRALVISEAQSLEERPEAARSQGFQGSVEATGIFRAPSQQQSASYAQDSIRTHAQGAAVGFPDAAFHRVILQDAAARGAAGSSTKASALKRLLLATAAVFCYSCNCVYGFLLRQSVPGERCDGRRAAIAHRGRCRRHADG